MLRPVTVNGVVKVNTEELQSGIHLLTFGLSWKNESALMFVQQKKTMFLKSNCKQEPE